MDVLIEKVIELMPLWTVIIIVIMFIVMKFYYTRFKVLEEKTKDIDCSNKDFRIRTLETKTIHADCQNKNSKIDELSSDMKQMKEDISSMKEDITAIKAVLIQRYPNAANVFSMKKSPRRLNKLGEEVFNQINGKDFLNEHKSFFFSKIDEMKPKTELDVENASNFACSAFTDNDIFNNIKDFVYNAPSLNIVDENGENKSYDITLGDVCYILSLPLRDMYLEEKFKK